MIRTACQVLDRAVLGSLEFGVAELQIPVLVVLGHEHCGDVVQLGDRPGGDHSGVKRTK